jgi:hypothetical protein
MHHASDAFAAELEPMFTSNAEDVRYELVDAMRSRSYDNVDRCVPGRPCSGEIVLPLVSHRTYIHFMLF